MGKAIIQSHLGNGLYRVKLQFDNAKVAARIAAIDAQLTDIAGKLTEAAAETAAKKADLDAANEALNAYIDATPPEEILKDPSEVQRLTAEAYQALGAYNIAVSSERLLNLRKTGLEKDRSYLQQNCPDEIETDAWCVAKNTVLSGTTATIECDYLLDRNGNQIERDTGVWLPGTIEQPAPTPPTTILQHAAAGSPHSVWFNLGVLPAAQRDQMRYRVGTITNLNKAASTCTVTFDGQAAINKWDGKLAPGVPIYPGLLESVAATIEYPPCGGNAFENGDRVIVKSGNVVIGFYSNPRDCPDPIADMPADFWVYVIGIQHSASTSYAGYMYIDDQSYDLDCGFGNLYRYAYAANSLQAKTNPNAGIYGIFAGQIPDVIAEGGYPTDRGTASSGMAIAPGVQWRHQTVNIVGSAFQTNETISVRVFTATRGDFACNGEPLIDNPATPVETFVYAPCTPVASFTLTSPDTGHSASYSYQYSPAANVLVYAR